MANLQNNRYVTISTIVAIASSLYPGLVITKDQAMEWAGYAQMYDLVMIRDWFLYRDVPLEIDQKKALLPCNCKKLLKVYHEDQSRVKYRHDGAYIFFDDNYDDVYITYRGLPVDEEGTPLFIQGTERALARYIIMNANEEKFLQGKLDGQRWSWLVEKWEDEKDTARASFRHMTRDDIQDLLMINADMVPKLGYIPTYNLD